MFSNIVYDDFDKCSMWSTPDGYMHQMCWEHFITTENGVCYRYHIYKDKEGTQHKAY